MSDLKYVRRQLALTLAAVRMGSRSTALDCIQRLSDGLDHVEHQMKAPEAVVKAAVALREQAKTDYPEDLMLTVLWTALQDGGY